MQNITTTSSEATSAVEAALLAATTPELAQDTTSATAVLDAPAPEGSLEQIMDPVVPPTDAVIEIAPAAPETQTPAPEATNEPLVYTKQDLLNAREYLLRCKQSGKFGGFGQKVGPMIRATIGYKFDSMDVKEFLKALDSADFLTKYQETTDKWFAGVKHDGVTGKSNFARHTEASKLTIDAMAFKTLVKSLRILCERNQDWHEKGLNLSLSMNGHRALLDFLGIQVTNSRRLKLAAN